MLEKLGRDYYNLRAELRTKRGEGYTEINNHFHDPCDKSLDISKLREAHDAMDRAVLDAYGWSDILPASGFFPEFEDEEEDAEEPESATTSVKSFRYRWTDEIQDEVLGRLLALNQQRAAVPQIETEPRITKKQRTPKTKKSKKTDEPNLLLFEPQIK